MGRNPLILDTDGGVDDAQALLMLIAAGVTPAAITTVFGNVGVDQATDNILAVLATAGVPVAVHKGCDRPLTQAVIDATYVHGDDGLGGAPRPATQARANSDDAVGLLRHSCREAAVAGRKVDILMIGPLTNLALALRLEPAIAAGIGQLTIMGGTVFGRGNVTPAAEFNIYADPEAASVVLSAEIDTVVVPWEACTAHFIDGMAIDSLLAQAPDVPLKRFSEALARHARRIIEQRIGRDIMHFVDPLAAAVVIDPTIVTGSLKASMAVALAPGLTRGMTLVDPTGRVGTPMLRIIETVDNARVRAFYAASISGRSETIA